METLTQQGDERRYHQQRKHGVQQELDIKHFQQHLPALPKNGMMLTHLIFHLINTGVDLRDAQWAVSCKCFLRHLAGVTCGHSYTWSVPGTRQRWYLLLEWEIAGLALLKLNLNCKCLQQIKWTEFVPTADKLKWVFSGLYLWQISGSGFLWVCTYGR